MMVPGAPGFPPFAEGFAEIADGIGPRNGDRRRRRVLCYVLRFEEPESASDSCTVLGTGHALGRPAGAPVGTREARVLPRTKWRS